MLREIRRPVFSLLEHGPLYENCTFLSYDAVQAIADIKSLAHMSDTILDEYEEGAEDDLTIFHDESCRTTFPERNTNPQCSPGGASGACGAQSLIDVIGVGQEETPLHAL